MDKASGKKEEGGDITSRFGINPHTIKPAIDDAFLLPFFRTESLYTKDISRIIQIVDTDGVFIPDSHVVQSADASVRVKYGDEYIYTSNVERILKRNAQKRENILHLVSTKSFETEHDHRTRAIPYSVFFFSANLDHFLHDDANLAQGKKIVMANDFAQECCFRPSLFYDRFTQDTDYVQCGYDESWERIQKGCNSLGRHSNLGILLSELKSGYFD